ncbi:MAG TPA: RNA polymerase sigma factor [Myxococcota bacterium]|nr:RNA polymerase sigma factor [Myxococcota bacterium]
MHEAKNQSEIGRGAAEIRPRGDTRGACRSGCPGVEEIAQLVSRLRPRLEAVALRVTREPEAARDVVQQAALKAIRFRHQYRGAAALPTWIHRIVVNEALMWKRGQQRRVAALERFEREAPELEIQGTPSMDELLDQRRRLVAVTRGLARLGLRDREVLEPFLAHTQPLRELTVRLGIPRTALRTRIFRARRRLLRLIETA